MGILAVVSSIQIALDDGHDFCGGNLHCGRAARHVKPQHGSNREAHDPNAKPYALGTS